MNFRRRVELRGGSIVLMLTVPARTLTRVLASDNYGDTLDRSQRELNPARAKKFYQYLVEAYENKEPFIIPPLVGNCDSYVEFEEFGNTNVGVARFPMDAEIKLFDGQHRAAGIAEYCRTIGINPRRDIPFEGDMHNALADAKHQAKYVSAIWQHLIPA